MLMLVILNLVIVVELGGSRLASLNVIGSISSCLVRSSISISMA